VPTIATCVPRGGFSWVTRKLRQEANGVTIPLVATNRINTPEIAEEILSKGDADLVSMARPFLADPFLLNKAKAGTPERINTCIACNQACLDHTFQMKIASCLVNPRAGYETELFTDKPTAQPLDVAVVGAGPAGLAFATTAAKRGHRVTLYEASDKIGGQFNLAKMVPGKEEFYETLRYFAHEIKATGVDLRLGTRVSAEQLQASGAQRVVLATGVTPRKLNIPGDDHPSVLSYVEVLQRTKPVGERVAIIGAGGIGFDVAEFLAHGADRLPPPKAPAQLPAVSSLLGGADHLSPRTAITTAAFLDSWGIDPTNGARAVAAAVPAAAKERQARRRLGQDDRLDPP